MFNWCVMLCMLITRCPEKINHKKNYNLLESPEYITKIVRFSSEFYPVFLRYCFNEKYVSFTYSRMDNSCRAIVCETVT